MFDFSLPRLDLQEGSPEEQRIKSYNYQLTDQLKYWLSHIGSDNLDEEMSAAFRSAVQTPAQLSALKENTEQQFVSLKNKTEQQIDALQDADSALASEITVADTLRHPTRIQPNTGADLDTYMSSGSWYVVSNADAETVANTPVNRAGYLYVMDSGVKTQVYMTITGPTYIRYYSNWSSPPYWASWTLVGGYDEVIDQGVSGIWYYKKYSSGAAEADGVYSFTPTAWTTSNNISRSYTPQISLPFTFAKLYTASVGVQKGPYNSWASSNTTVSPSSPGNNAASVQGIVFQFQNSTLSTITLAIHAVGRWKA